MTMTPAHASRCLLIVVFGLLLHAAIRVLLNLLGTLSSTVQQLDSLTSLLPLLAMHPPAVTTVYVVHFVSDAGVMTMSIGHTPT